MLRHKRLMTALTVSFTLATAGVLAQSSTGSPGQPAGSGRQEADQGDRKEAPSEQTQGQRGQQTGADERQSPPNKESATDQGPPREQTVTRSISMNDLPDAVRSTLEQKASGGKVKKVQEVTARGETVYEATIEKDGKTQETVIDANGRVIRHPASHHHSGKTSGTGTGGGPTGKHSEHTQSGSGSGAGPSGGIGSGSSGSGSGPGTSGSGAVPGMGGGPMGTGTGMNTGGSGATGTGSSMGTGVGPTGTGADLGPGTGAGTRSGTGTGPGGATAPSPNSVGTGTSMGTGTGTTPGGSTRPPGGPSGTGTEPGGR